MGACICVSLCVGAVGCLHAYVCVCVWGGGVPACVFAHGCVWGGGGGGVLACVCVCVCSDFLAYTCIDYLPSPTISVPHTVTKSGI